VAQHEKRAHSPTHNRFHGISVQSNAEAAEIAEIAEMAENKKYRFSLRRTRSALLIDIRSI